ncbi:MAG: DinB family protein [Saprospiraceae bacterium]|nr:DinB family protein [Saprospiraceae bacterium]MCF8248469.1 DinB family protein [Saprospiraceae bacterium]MCF8281801.1 DinB family protein [Bacteroidales bacterium]MCF8310203.1 DinB family protein [Saprospiraceae bacterium]MCF8439358.1 DinB family protein [Saprospiraceae bacterium]
MTAIEQLVLDFKTFYSSNPWYGSSYTDVISDITPAEALTTPPNQHSIAVLLWHMVKWRRALTIRLLGNLDFRADDSDADNWVDASAQTAESWEAVKAAFAEQQKILMEQLPLRDEDFLDTEFVPGSTFRQLVSGVLQHDIYHLGQVAMLKGSTRNGGTWQ